MKTNKEIYKNAFDEVHAPAELFGKVEVSQMEHVKRRSFKGLRIAVSAFAALLFLVVVSNGICYAATGDTWITKVKVIIDGKETEADMTWHQEGDYMVGTIEYEVPEGREIFVCDEEDVDGNSEIEYNTPGLTEGRLEVENDRIYLVVEDSKVDITEDFTDGEATGSIELAGVQYVYTVTGTAEDYDVSFDVEE
ncbi:MAG: hypothetical protein J6L77_04850 [Coprococcus sp.]|nr:hypothetical protein [Lachnospiraceae bacterium]MBP3325731.1 hypothetical protein [Coprococcus sp.]